MSKSDPALTPAAKPEAKPADVPVRAIHLRNDAPLSAVVDRVNGLADWLYTLESRLASLEKPADKPAARVVKAPKCEHYYAGQYRSGFCDALAVVRTALASHGITVEAAE